ncbi:acetolactate synthase 2 regulatory subunit [Xenorhabdus beddingii]|uniref:Acetolactate synthase 2 regulatory subunit n=1 Tax=Xenorhabdus beddingii TaxID=40578 RepID=A0A1Y2SPI0_9GAMM|nr:acetolactate synthase 2 small subunit [Xenorhabdus beddingii]OTA20950.1 acetolactate synthase 2 regulatory subunit [Xenorhabdus beddingii]
MMQHQLAIQAKFCPEILERILRVIRHRGFRVCALNMDHTRDSDNVSIELTVTSQRPVNLLFSQLMKLVDVAGVEIQDKESQLIRAN